MCSLVQKQDDYSATGMVEPNLGNIQVESNMALTISYASNIMPL